MHTNTAHTHHQCYVILLSHRGSSSEQLGHEPGSTHTHTHTVILSLHITRYQLALISWRLKAGPSIRFHHLHYGDTVPTVFPTDMGPHIVSKTRTVTEWKTLCKHFSSAHQMPETNSHQSHMTQDRPAAGYHGVHARTHTALR